MATIHDPLYGSVHVEGVACKILDTPAFQRLAQIRQLQLASVVYRSAVHTRFEHSVGVYHLTKRALRRLQETGQLAGVSEEDIELLLLAGISHDLGHFSGGHMAEEVGLDGADHERAGEVWLTSGEIGEILERTDIPNAAKRIAQIIRQEGDNPLRAIVAGDCDVDKIDYIGRDAYHCGLPGGFDQNALIDAYVLVRDPVTGELAVGIKERAIAAFEQMLYAKFNLYRSVYFHPTVRSATVMMRALVTLALEAGLLSLEELHLWTDQELFILLRSRVLRWRRNPLQREGVGQLIERLQNRLLYYPLVSRPLSSAPDLTVEQLYSVEKALARELGLKVGEVLLDVPRKPTMLSTEVLVLRPSGVVVYAGDLGPDEGFALGTATDALYNASGRWGVFATGPDLATPARAAAALDDVLPEHQPTASSQNRGTADTGRLV